VETPGKAQEKPESWSAYVVPNTELAEVRAKFEASPELRWSTQYDGNLKKSLNRGFLRGSVKVQLQDGESTWSVRDPDSKSARLPTGPMVRCFGSVYQKP
jgi:hypothetical protein